VSCSITVVMRARVQWSLSKPCSGTLPQRLVDGGKLGVSLHADAFESGSTVRGARRRGHPDHRRQPRLPRLDPEQPEEPA
jgi:hypothetical protein